MKNPPEKRQIFKARCVNAAEHRTLASLLFCRRYAPEIGLVKESIYSENDGCRFNRITVPAR